MRNNIIFTKVIFHPKLQPGTRAFTSLLVAVPLEWLKFCSTCSSSVLASFSWGSSYSSLSSSISVHSPPNLTTWQLVGGKTFLPSKLGYLPSERIWAWASLLHFASCICSSASQTHKSKLHGCLTLFWLHCSPWSVSHMYGHQVVVMIKCMCK